MVKKRKHWAAKRVGPYTGYMCSRWRRRWTKKFGDQTATIAQAARVLLRMKLDPSVKEEGLDWLFTQAWGESLRLPYWIMVQEVPWWAPSRALRADRPSSAARLERVLACRTRLQLARLIDRFDGEVFST